ncbi:MAG: ribonuclease P protein component [Candidatus Margulisiibacteriota bacterium]
MLPKCARLSSEREIRNTIRKKQYESKSPLLYLVAKDNSLDESRLAVVIPKKIGKAVVRNRLRRVFQAGFVEIRHKIAKNIDVVLFPRHASVGFDMKQAAECLGQSIKRIRFA